MTALAQDIGKMKAREKVNVTAVLVQAARDCGRNPISIYFDYLRLRKQPGKLQFYEYILYELYDKARWNDAERDEFVSAHIHWPLVTPCNDRTWWAVTEDKWLSSCFLEQNGVPVPKTLAVFDNGRRSYGDTRKLTNETDLKSFLSERREYPIFGKPIRGVWSAGAMRIAGHTNTHILMDGERPSTYEEVAKEFIGDQPYIFQDCLTPHSFFDGITDAMPTIRSVNILNDNGLTVPYTLLKLPRQGNIADNLWRAGNLLCEVDPKTGTIKSIVSVKDGRRSTLDSLPDTNRKLVGEALPFWDNLRELNESVALLHAANRYGSTDIALTPDGPVVVEVNNSCAFELVQIGTGKGFLTPEMASFFRKHGAKI